MRSIPRHSLLVRTDRAHLARRLLAAAGRSVPTQGVRIVLPRRTAAASTGRRAADAALDDARSGGFRTFGRGGTAASGQRFLDAVGERMRVGRVVVPRAATTSDLYLRRSERMCIDAPTAHTLEFDEAEPHAAEQAALDRIRERLRAQMRADGSAPEPGPYLATRRGWLPLRLDGLQRLAASVAFAGGSEFLLQGLQAISSQTGVLEAAPLAVDLVDPERGTLQPTDDCTVRSLEPWRFARRDSGAVHLVGRVAFDFVFDDALARALDGGAALACLSGAGDVHQRCVRTRMRREGTRIIAAFDELLPGVESPPEIGGLVLRYRLVPPGAAADTVIGA